MDDSPVLGSVCSPPEKRERKIYRAKCPQCGNGPYLQIGLNQMCSAQCQSRWHDHQQRIKIERDASDRESKKKAVRSKKKRNRKRKRIEKPHLDPIMQRQRILQSKYGQSFYTSRAWLEVRYEAIRKSGGYCEACGRCKRDGATLHVDHIKPRSKYPNLELMLDNLQVLCEQCNIGKSNSDEIDWRSRY